MTIYAPTTTFATDLAWEFLLQIRTQARMVFDADNQPTTHRFTWTLMGEPKIAMVVLAIARLQDTRNTQVTAKDLLELGLPNSAVRSALKMLRDFAPASGPTVRCEKQGHSWAFYLDD